MQSIYSALRERESFCMKKKTVRSILYIGEIIFCFLKIFDFTQYNGTMGNAIMHSGRTDHTSLVDEIQISFGADPPFETYMDIFIYLFFIALAVNVILSLLNLLKPKMAFPRKAEIAINALPVFFFLIVAIISQTSHTTYVTELYIYFDYRYELNVLFIIFSLIIFVNFILLFIPFPEATTKAQKTYGDAKDISESLMYYKSLLDNNIITQEEFDTKKKQLLQ